MSAVCSRVLTVCGAALWFAIGACSSSSDDGGGETPAEDAGAPVADARVVPDARAPLETADAAEPATATPDACGAGKVSCDDVCIDAIAPTASALVTRVFAGSCGFASSCHGGTSPKEGLALDTVDRLFATAVDQPSTEAAMRKLVAPGQPEASYLMDKLLGQNLALDPRTGETSTIMPQPPSDPLCEAKIAAVRAWIAAGATR